MGGKTGTTNDHKDRWFCGITPDYVGVVWVGYDTPKDIPGYTTLQNPALKAWRSVMAIADKNPVKTTFPANGDVVQEPYNPATGYVTQKPTTAYGWYKVDDIPAAPVPASAS